jgi:hypothetical protein
MTGSGETGRPAFDPRHDARFQRGYRPGQEHPAPVERPRPNSPAAPTPDVGPASTAAFVRDAAGGREAQADGRSPEGQYRELPPETSDPIGPIRQDANQEGADLDDLDDLGFDADDFRDEPAPSRWNPFIILLWVIGIAFPVGGVALQWHAVQAMYGGVSFSGDGAPSIDFLLQQFSYLIAPTLITPGIVIVAGLLFWHARAWQARRSPRPETPLS